MNAEYYRALLREELKKATGCTEPIAVAYCAAVLRTVFEGEPEKLVAHLSGNMLKNVKSVVVPNTGGHRGIGVAAATGFVAGNADAKLQVIAEITPEQQARVEDFLCRVPVEIHHKENTCALYIEIEAFSPQCHARVCIAKYHTNIVRIEKNGEVLLNEMDSFLPEEQDDENSMSLESIFKFVTSEPLESLHALLDEQIICNSAIAREGLTHPWGAGIGRILLQRGGIEAEACGYAAAGSDARMSGCEMPVVILSGSGNQGITASMPVLRYADYLKVSEELRYRALVLSDLVTLHIKCGIGRLSAFCGAICAGVGAGAGIAYLHEQSFEAVSDTVSNASAILAGTVCDGAKPSCASKIAEAVNAGIIGYQMHVSGRNFRSGDGIIGENTEATVQNIGILGRVGMAETDRVILNIMEKTG